MNGRANNGPKDQWPEPAVAMLRAECAIGTSSSQIAKKLYAELGVSKSRNAVIGKAIRLGVTRMVIAKASAPRQVAVAPRLGHIGASVASDTIRGKSAKVILGDEISDWPKPPVAACTSTALLDLKPGQCRMPIGEVDSPAFSFCGRKCCRRRGRFESYCEEHKRVVFEPAPKIGTRAWGRPVLATAGYRLSRSGGGSMGYSANSHKSFQPVSGEVIRWRALAEHASNVAMNQSRQWIGLKDKAIKARKLTVFGPNDHGNVCNRLIEVAILTAESTEPHRHYPELERLAGEVLKRCNAWAVVRMGELRS